MKWNNGQARLQGNQELTEFLHSFRFKNDGTIEPVPQNVSRSTDIVVLLLSRAQDDTRATAHTRRMPRPDNCRTQDMDKELTKLFTGQVVWLEGDALVNVGTRRRRKDE